MRTEAGSPPQIPKGSLLVHASLRHCCLTGHAKQMLVAREASVEVSSEYHMSARPAKSEHRASRRQLSGDLLVFSMVNIVGVCRPNCQYNRDVVRGVCRPLINRLPVVVRVLS